MKLSLANHVRRQRQRSRDQRGGSLGTFPYAVVDRICKKVDPASRARLRATCGAVKDALDADLAGHVADFHRFQPRTLLPRHLSMGVSRTRGLDLPRTRAAAPGLTTLGLALAAGDLALVYRSSRPRAADVKFAYIAMGVVGGLCHAAYRDWRAFRADKREAALVAEAEALMQDIAPVAAREGVESGHPMTQRRGRVLLRLRPEVPDAQLRREADLLRRATAARYALAAQVQERLPAAIAAGDLETVGSYLGALPRGTVLEPQRVVETVVLALTFGGVSEFNSATVPPDKLTLSREVVNRLAQLNALQNLDDSQCAPACEAALATLNYVISRRDVVMIEQRLSFLCVWPTSGVLVGEDFLHMLGAMTTPESYPNLMNMLEDLFDRAQEQQVWRFVHAWLPHMLRFKLTTGPVFTAWATEARQKAIAEGQTDAVEQLNILIEKARYA